MPPVERSDVVNYCRCQGLPGGGMEGGRDREGEGGGEREGG